MLGGALRLYGLDISPPSLNWDEAAWGYNAYSISKTLKDEYKVTLPIFTRSFDEYKSSLPMYLMIPSFWVFGINEIGVRFPPAFLGTLAIIVVFLITKKIFKSEWVALVSSFVFAVEPWSVHFARTYHDGTEAMFFLFLGLLLFLYSREKKHLLLFSAISFMISMFTYNSNKIVVPIFVVMLLVINKKTILSFPKKILLPTFLIVILSVGVFLVLAIKGQAFARVSSTNIFVLWQTETTNLNLNHNLEEPLRFLLHNDVYYFLTNIVSRYFAYFSPPNLFLKEPSEPVTVVSQNSVFHPFDFIFWIVGLVIVLKNFRKYKNLLALLFISPIPAMMTWNWFQPGRTMSLYVIFSMLTGLGIYKITKIFNSYIFSFAVIIFYLLSAVYLFDSIIVQLPLKNAGSWQPGFKETVPIVYELSNNYNQVIIETPHAQPYIFYLFYSSYPPDKYLNEIDLQKIGTPRKSYDFGKFIFRKIYWPEDRNLKNTLFVGSPFSLPETDVKTQPNAKLIQDVIGKDGYIVSRIVAID